MSQAKTGGQRDNTDATEESHVIRTRFGIEFDARCDVWPIDGKRVIPVGGLRSIVSADLLYGLERALRDGATRYSWSTLAAFSSSLRRFQKKMFPLGIVTRWDIADIRPYRVNLMESFGHEDSLRHLRSLLVNWQTGRWPGVSADFVHTLREMKLKGSETGRAVRVMDVDEGPLSLGERHNLVHSLHDAAESGSLTLSDYSLAYLHVMTGRRPIQSAQLKCKDVVLQMGPPEAAYPQGRLQHLLAIPRAKQKGHGFRETRRAIDLSAENFQIYRSLLESVQEQFRSMMDDACWHLQFHDMKHVLKELPLFPDWEVVAQFLIAAADLRSKGGYGHALEALRRDAGGAAWHRDPSIHALRIIKICESVGALSRDGMPINVSATRLRYTKGTDLAREGLPAHIIAWLLDHSTSRSAEIYTDNLPERAAEINAAIGLSPMLQRFAQAFRGEVVASEADAVGGKNPQRSRLAYQGKGTATCGVLKQCGLHDGVPFVCYTCSHFQPWLDGPHEALLADLHFEREANIAILGTDNAVAKRRDTLIIAVQNVVDLCRVQRANAEESTSEASAI